MSGFQDIDKINPKRLAYIEAWQKAQEALNGNVTYFGNLPVGAKFTLPGGRIEQVKLTPTLALAWDRVVRYWPWERVVPVGEAIPFEGEPMPNKEVSARDYYGV